MQYEIKALRGKEGLATLVLDAADVHDATGQARSQGYAVIGIRPKTGLPLVGRMRRRPFPVVLFSQELLSLLDAGLALVEALDTLAEKEQRPDIKKTLARINGSLREGRPLSSALEQSGTDFPALYVETIRASEKTGALPEVLLRYIAYQKKMDSVRSQMISSAIYPVLVTLVGGSVMLFLLLYVVPRFSRIYSEINTNLPLMSRLLMEWGQILATHGWQALIVLTALLGAFASALMRPSFKQWLKQRIWQIPTIGAHLRIYQLARFYRSLGMLLRGGMPVVHALQMVSGQLEFALRDQLAQATGYVRNGQSISQAMEHCGLTTPVAQSMIRVGERTGQMGEMMERIAAFHEEETARWLERFMKLFEPLLMAFVGLVIGIIVVLMYFPIFELAGSIQ